MAALVGSGLPLDRFTFFGFIARKGRERAAAIDDIVKSRFTTVVFEAANRVAQTLSALAAAGAGERKAVMARELTKQFEEFRRGTIDELVASCEETVPRGEVVLAIAGAEDRELTESELAGEAKKVRKDGMSPREVMDHLVQDLGAPRNLAYRIAHGSDQ